MRLPDLLASPWAIAPAKLDILTEIYNRHLAGVRLSREEIEARIGRQPGGGGAGTQVMAGIAVIPIDGVIAKRANLFMDISGGTSSDLIARDFRAALADPQIKGILLRVDSPGGAVDGTQELAREIFAARGLKPIVAFTDGAMMSGAYWIGAAADRIVISSDTVEVGSIGVVAQHIDRSRARDQAGIKVTEVVAGKFKRVTTTDGPLSAVGQMTLQAHVDYIYSVFLGDVANFRGETAERVHERMADGRVFLGKQAIEVGLADARDTFEGVLARMHDGDFDSNEDEEEEGDMEKKGGQAATTVLADVASITLAELAQRRPDLAEALRVEGQAQFKATHVEEVGRAREEFYKKGLEQGFAQGAEAERARIKGVLAHAMPGHRELAEQLAFDGKTTPDQAAGQILAAEREARQKKGEEWHKDAPDPLPPARPAETAGSPERKREAAIQALIDESQAKMSYADAAIEASRRNPELFREKQP